jgi:hypothetical protein
MAKITTKGVKRNDYQAKDLRPGQVEARIVSLAVVKSEKPRDPKVPEYNIEIGLVGRKPSEDFVGLQKNFDDPTKGNWDGPYKKVKHGTWSIKTFTFNNKKGEKVTVEYSDQIIQVLQEICEGYGKPNLFDEKKYQDGFDSWSLLIKEMNQDLQFTKKYAWFCLGGTKTKNDKGYDVYFLSLVERKTTGNKPRIAETQEKLCEYNAETQLYVKANPSAPNDEEDEEFNEEEESTGTDAQTDEDLFDGADEFDEFEEMEDDDDLPL